MTYSFNAINTPISGSRNPVPYVNGLTASWLSTTTLTLNPGACSDSLNIIDMVVPTAITISGTTQGVNGIDNDDALTASSIYFVFVIGDSSGFNKPAGLISLDPVSPKLPYGYDSFRVVDIKYTNSTPNFILSYTNGEHGDREFVYDTPVLVLNGGSANTFTSVDLSTVAFGAIKVNLIASITPVAVTGAGDSIILKPGASSSTKFAELSGSVAGKAQVGELECLIGDNWTIDYILTAAGDVGSLWLKSYNYNIYIS